MCKSTEWWSADLRQATRTRPSFPSRTSLSPSELALFSENIRQLAAPKRNAAVYSQNGSQYNCTVCPERFSHTIDLKTHIYQCHPNVKDAFPFVCDVCQQGFFSKKTLKQHSEKHSSKVFQCQLCSKTFGYTRSMLKHQEVDHCVRKCRRCKQFFTIGEEFNQHSYTCFGLGFKYKSETVI